MERTVAETIRDITREHLEQRNGMLLGQCITAVGWIQNTVPPHCKNLVELSMTDVAGPSFAAGAAIVGRRPIFVVRFQSFLWLAASPIVNHIAKSKDIFGYPCPVFIRAIATDHGGPVHSNCYHSIFMHMPGLPVVAPMTPSEYQEIWKYYLEHDDPMLVSEHRTSYSVNHDLHDTIRDAAEITLYAISASRFTAAEAVKRLERKGIRCNLIHLYWLKPFQIDSRILEPLKQSGKGIVIDSAFEIAGASQVIAYNLMLQTGRPVKALGQWDRSSGVAAHLENGTPTPERIVQTVEEFL